MVTIELKNNTGFKWYSDGKFFFKGYFYLNNAFHDGDDALRLLKSLLNNNSLDNIAKELNGCYSIILITELGVIISVDRVRCFPVFYYADIKKDNVIISDDAKFILTLVKEPRINEISKNEFLLLGYVTGKETLFSDIYQVEAGSTMFISANTSKTISIKSYAFSEKLNEPSESKYTECLDSLFSSVIQRLVDSVKGKTIVIPLSGGYDSRLVAVLLKKYNKENVICYTYGRPNSYEVNTSKKVAKNLGYKWYYIEYNNSTWNNFFHSSKFLEYFNYSANLSSNPHFQDFIAIEELMKKQLINKDMIIVPGHSGDLLGGSQIPVEICEGNFNQLLKSGIAEKIFSQFYCLNKTNNETKKKLINKINSQLQSQTPSSIDDFVLNYDAWWFIRGKISKFIVNSMRQYEYFGLAWRLPLWDEELVEFWYKIPTEYRLYNRLYNRYLFENYFKPYNVDFKKEKKVTVSKSATFLKQHMPYFIVDNLRNLVHQLRNKKETKHFNAFNDIYDFVYSELVKNGIAVEKTMNLNQVIAIYYLYSINQK